MLGCMRILVAGCGYVGAALAAARTAAGDTVHALRRSEAAPPAGARALRADLTRPETLEGLPAVDAVVFAPTPDTPDEAGYRRTYVEGARHLAVAIARESGAARWIHVSSTAVFEVDDGSWVEESTPTRGEGFRAACLLASEAVPVTAGFRTTALRFGGIYGPGRTGVIRRIRSRQAVSRPRYTNRIHRDDVAAAIRHVLALADPPACLIGVDRDPAAESDVNEWIAAHVGAPAPPRAAAAPTSGKRCRSDRLVASGFAFSFPDYRAGYAPLLEEEEGGG